MCDCKSGCDACNHRGFICVRRGDSTSVLFTVRDTYCDGDLFDISNVADVKFIVADEFGGTVRIDKSLGAGIALAGNGYQFFVTISSSDTDALIKRSNYYEARMVTATGLYHTTSGVFISDDTMIRNIV